MACAFCTGHATAAEFKTCRNCYLRIGRGRIDKIIAEVNAKDTYGNRKSVYERTQIINKAIAKWRK